MEQLDKLEKDFESVQHLGSLSDSIIHDSKQREELLKIITEELSPYEVEPLAKLLNSSANSEIGIAVFGRTNSGKSSLLNVLAGYDPDSSFPFGSNANSNWWDTEQQINNGFKWHHPVDKSITVIYYDTPGIAGDFKEHLSCALEIARSVNLVIYVFKDQIVGEEKNIFEDLLATDVPIIPVLNQVDTLKTAQIDAFYESLRSNRKFIEYYEKAHGKTVEMNGTTTERKFTKEDLVFTSASPLPHYNNGLPYIDKLVREIRSILINRQEWIVDKRTNQEIIKTIRKVAERIDNRINDLKDTEKLEKKSFEENLSILEKKAGAVVKGYATTAAAFAALLPFGIDYLVDAIVGAGMLIHISKHYEKEMDTKTLAKLARSFVEAAIGVFLTSFATLTVYQAISKAAKTNPFTYLVGMALDGIFTFFIFCVVGDAFSYYCRKNLTEAEMEKVIEHMKRRIASTVIKNFWLKLPKKARGLLKKTGLDKIFGKEALDAIEKYEKTGEFAYGD